ncbi:uncharacterized protein ASCRUDRAFT_76557 [Ascoidea rubescens DSM 1968]|uniref:Uncharacterized protein n=1 Tax=Ascoidea rubescens DSM 1968 TaxID=1344418 RepID=A0A1D2VEY3_9ASCO|nr:hypothetical protein ASCRUDRAFT_76557 [Ascoidea rubescens DSM 1968]ODV60027.1 hypothetical protein ASCRUDRAFT_76557 [Ascoidea rubescens DSM 1968]
MEAIFDTHLKSLFFYENCLMDCYSLTQAYIQYSRYLADKLPKSERKMANRNYDHS